MRSTVLTSLLLIFFACLILPHATVAQPKPAGKKYPSLLWEIRGNGMKKPSYLIGTMHVSSKLAFNLPDSFFLAIRNSEVVALETNPETWQDDLNKYDIGDDGAGSAPSYSNFYQWPTDYLNIRTLKFYKYDKKIERSLYSNPSTINNLLYRSYGNESSDFEEDTYLDMYIYQCGKKLGKKVTGVEDYGESLRLMAEGYRDAAKEKNKIERSFRDYNERYSSGKLQESYRKGDLDWLDSINRYNSESAAFDEKFIYRRNELQAGAIDSILRSGSSLFVGVGAAHLPGDRGVIEILRKKGFILRPVKMGERASQAKEQLEKIRVPVTFRTETISDGSIRVEVPGKLHKLDEDASLEQWQYADMANGSYYMITRLMTNAWMWNQTQGNVMRVVDSLLYENIPGKIISKTVINRNGYPGYDIINRTRRGDYQRYQIYVTPFEVIFFKMSGTGDYIRKGTEAGRFFGSIQMREYRAGNETDANANAWKKYQPAWGGFSVDLPHEPYVGNDGSWIFDAHDKASGNYYRLIRSDIHHYSFAEEDSFDLGLMQESFAASEFIDSLITRKFITWQGYPALEASFRHRDGKVFLARFLIRGPHYYTLAALGTRENAAMKQFLNSFSVKPFSYGQEKAYTDTSLYFSVKAPWFPESKKIRININRYSYDSDEEEDSPSSDAEAFESGLFRSRLYANDSTGEKVCVGFFRAYRYHQLRDSAELDKDNEGSFMGDSTWIVRRREKYDRPDGFRVWDMELSDTGSSRLIKVRSFYRNGVGYSISAEADTLGRFGPFVSGFFNSFVPADTLAGVNPFRKASPLFFDDLFSGDSVRYKRAVKHIGDIPMDSTDLPLLKKAIGYVNWREKKYLDTKTSLIGKLGGIKTREAAAYLKEIYFAAGDTVQLQYAALENLLQHRNSHSFGLFGEIVRTDPPVPDMETSGYSFLRDYSFGEAGDYDNGNFLDELRDSLPLVKAILPDLLPLLNLDDYKLHVMQLLDRMVDSNLVRARDYENYYTKFYFEARQVLKKQAILEKKKAIEKAEEEKVDKPKSRYLDMSSDPDEGNDDLSLYANLLIPFQSAHPEVKTLLQQMLRSGDKRLRYNTFMQLLDHGPSWPDSLPRYFAGLEEFRYELYLDLLSRNKLSLFPSALLDKVGLAKSALLFYNGDDKPDSLEYLRRLPAVYKGKDGFIYFFRYKEKKDDLNWKIATAGLVAGDSARFVFEDQFTENGPGLWRESTNRYDFNALKEWRLSDDEPQEKQLRTLLKKMLFARRKSAAKFYVSDDGTPEETVEDD